MYAIFEDGGKQYKVSEGDIVLLERKDLAEGQQEVTFDRVLMLGEGSDAKIGTPWVDGATITAKVHSEVKMPKIQGIKFLRRKGHSKKWGHRQKALRVEITKIAG